MAVVVQATNTTGGTLTYSNEGLTIGSGATVTVPNYVLLAFSDDVSVVSDILAGRLTLTDGVHTYSTRSALNFLAIAIAQLPLIKSSQTFSSPTAVSVGVTSASAVAANSARTDLVLMNLSTGVISFGIGVSAVLNSGITLYPGGLWEMDSNTFSTAAINAIASVAASNLSVQEMT